MGMSFCLPSKLEKDEYKRMVFRQIGFLLLISMTSFPFLFSQEIAWKKVKLEKGVTVYQADVQGRIAFRGIGELVGKSEELVSIIEDPIGWKNWIENLKSGKLIEEVSKDHKFFYQAIRSPFPLSDRDVVYESKIFRDKPGRTRIEMKSVIHRKAPKTIGVRVNILFSRYIIEMIDDNRIMVTFETCSVPGGALPDFLVNWASENYPVTLLNGLARQLKNLKKKEK